MNVFPYFILGLLMLMLIQICVFIAIMAVPGNKKTES